MIRVLILLTLCVLGATVPFFHASGDETWPDILIRPCDHCLTVTEACMNPHPLSLVLVCCSFILMTVLSALSIIYGCIPPLPTAWKYHTATWVLSFVWVLCWGFVLGLFLSTTRRTSAETYIQWSSGVLYTSCVRLYLAQKPMLFWHITLTLSFYCVSPYILLFCALVCVSPATLQIISSDSFMTERTFVEDNRAL